MHAAIRVTPITEKSERAKLLTDLVTAANSGELSAENRNQFWKTVADVSLQHLNLRFRNLSPDDREDISQKVAIKLCQNPTVFNDPSTATSFVQKCAVNEALSYKRTERRRNESAPSLSIDEYSADLADLKITSPSRNLIANEELALLKSALGLLSTGQKMAVEMRLEGASMEEISKKANRPVGTIKRWAHEGMNKLQEALSGRI